MRPTLFEVFGQPLPAYFTLLLLGFGLATWLGARIGRKMGFDYDTFIDLGLFSVIMGVLGARVLHVLADGYFWDYVNLCLDHEKVAWKITQAQCVQAEGIWKAAEQVCQPAERDCLAWAAFWRGGLAYYGGLIAAAWFGVWFLKREGFPVYKGADLAGPAICLGLFFGRMGCFLGGCCFGVTTDHEVGLSFPPWSPASESQWRDGLLSGPHLASLPVHPTQLYEAIGCLAIAAFLMLIAHPRKRFDGQVMLLFLGLYSVLRFVLEYWRADDRGELLGLSTSQAIGVPIMAAVVVLWVIWSRRAKARLSTPLTAPLPP